MFLIILIKLSKFASSVSRKISSVAVLRLRGEALVTLVAELDEQLEALRTDLKPFIHLGTSFNPNRPTPGLTSQQAIYLHCVYHTTELDIHNTLTYPWSQNLVQSNSCAKLRAQVSASTDRVISSCHAATMTLNHVSIDAATPVPYVSSSG